VAPAFKTAAVYIILNVTASAGSLLKTNSNNLKYLLFSIRKAIAAAFMSGMGF
jgi:hypothetical protein